MTSGRRELNIWYTVIFKISQTIRVGYKYFWLYHVDVSFLFLCVYSSYLEIAATVMWIKVLKWEYVFRTDICILKYFFALLLIAVTEANYSKSLLSTLSRYNFVLRKIHKCAIQDFSPLCINIYWLHFLSQTVVLF